MDSILIVVHVTGAAIVIGVLFIQSLTTVMSLRLKNEEQRSGVRILQAKIEKFVYYPILAVTLLFGLFYAKSSNAFSHGKWLHWKLLVVVVLVGVGVLIGNLVKKEKIGKPFALILHIAVFFLAAGIIYLATIKPI